MERDMMIAEARSIQARLNELHGALAESGVIVEISCVTKRTHFADAGVIPEIFVVTSYKQTL